MTTTTTEPVDLRGADLFWHVMDLIAAQQRGESATDFCSIRWNQADWRQLDRCNTALCLAGWICEVTGGEWAVTSDGDGGLLLHGEPWTNTSLFNYLEFLIGEADDSPDNIDTRWACCEVIRAKDRAMRLLGLDTAYTCDDEWLFAGGHGYDDLVRIGTKLFGPRPVAA